MDQYNSLNVRLSNSQLTKSAIKNETEVVLKLSSNMIGDSDDKINFPLFRSYLQALFCLNLDLYWKRWFHCFPEFLLLSEILLTLTFFFGLVA